MPKLLKFLLLVILLNVARYLLGAPLEMVVIFKPLFGVMSANSSYFNTDFKAFDWATSFFYNFMMWLTAEWVFVLLAPVLRGNWYIKSLKVYALMALFFISVSCIYMNHYTHPKSFYFWNLVDAAMVFPLVGVVNGFLYPRLMGERAVAKAAVST
jgi:hypothetical protein